MSHEIKRPLALIILDGWGVSPNRDGNAIALAHTPNYDELCKRYPSTKLAAAGVQAGMAGGPAGNAEAGHRTMGAGRTVETDAARIERAVAQGDLLQNEVLRSSLARAAASGSPVHFVGLLGDGGVHSSQETLFALLRMAKAAGVGNAYVHCILDGRDVRPRTADIYVDALEIKMADIGLGVIASLCGRFYAMDSGQNWERTARAYTMLVHGEGERGFDAVTAIRASFLRGISDEFIAPIVIEKEIDVPVATMKDGDLVVFFNHTGEPMRQLVRSLAVPDPTSPKPKIHAVCLTEYDPSFELPVAYAQPQNNNLLFAVLEQHGIRNYRITETSRSAHLSAFFNGHPNAPGELERRVFLQGNTLETEPESQSFKIADTFIRGIEAAGSGVFIVNFPAAALSAETGNLPKTVESIQFMDTCLGGVVDAVREMNGVAVITSSHAGCEEILSPAAFIARTGQPPNPLPFHFIDPQDANRELVRQGSLEDVAPTILGVLGIGKPAEMTGQDLRIG